VNVCSLEFLVPLLLASAVFFSIPTARLKQAFLALCNLGLLYTLVPETKDWLALGLFLASGYVVARLQTVHPQRWILATYLTLLVAVFAIVKKYEFLSVVLPPSVVHHTIAIVGLSYMLFRQIHVAVDASQGQIDNLSLWTFVNYQANLFGLLAGPIQRYQDFAADWNTLEPLSRDAYEILRAYRRIFIGVIKITVIAAVCLNYFETYADELAGPAGAYFAAAYPKLVLLFYLYPAYIYFNFSGYCDIVIAGAWLFGIRMPENFHFPFLSRNLIDYWTRFHATLGLWIRDYVFTPMYKAVAVSWPSQAASLAFLCYFVAFLLAGVWHGSTWNFVIYGLLNGLGVASAKLWESWLVKRYGRQGFKRYLQSRGIRALAVAGTFHYVCFTLIFFPADYARTLKIFNNLVRLIA
jgi:D-alanyl-lipoteichoic acid acyltransferase DltB (MBOAT superfamily)